MDVFATVRAVLAADLEHCAEPDEFVIVTYRPREFMGEIGLLTGQRVCLTAVVSAPGRVLRIPVQQVHTIMDQERGAYPEQLSQLGHYFELYQPQFAELIHA